MIWAPWRLPGVIHRKDVCIFCALPADGPEKDEENLIVYRGRLAYVIMNKYPYNNGHVMVVPYRHVKDMGELANDEALEMLELISFTESCIRKKMNPDGFNIGVNIGIDAGAGYEHLHVHMVPRWRGDTNFMPVFSEVKVIPESVYETYKKLKECFGQKTASAQTLS